MAAEFPWAGWLLASPNPLTHLLPPQFALETVRKQPKYGEAWNRAKNSKFHSNFFSQTSTHPMPPACASTDPLTLPAMETISDIYASTWVAGGHFTLKYVRPMPITSLYTAILLQMWVAGVC
ncbi:hypothetical protein BC828DRAFT_400982 [Blastocladiella britannica]|nr:hypothetical protein BC828DRAFT_400982 [Blastocladiella britannica]